MKRVLIILICAMVLGVACAGETVMPADYWPTQVALQQEQIALQPLVNDFYDPNSPNYGGMTVQLNNELITAVQEVQAAGIRGQKAATDLAVEAQFAHAVWLEIQGRPDRLDSQLERLFDLADTIVPPEPTATPPDELCPHYATDVLDPVPGIGPAIIATVQAYFACVPL